MQQETAGSKSKRKLKRQDLPTGNAIIPSANQPLFALKVTDNSVTADKQKDKHHLNSQDSKKNQKVDKQSPTSKDATITPLKPQVAQLKIYQDHQKAFGNFEAEHGPRLKSDAA